MRAPAQTRHRLVEAAAVVLADKGFHAAAIDEICSAAGLSRGAFHWHFASKEDLLFAVLEHRRATEVAASDARTARANDGGASLDDVISDELDAQSADERRRWALLWFEAILYAARHPEAMSRLEATKRASMDVITARARLIEDRLVLDVEHVTALFQAVNDGLALQDLLLGSDAFADRYQRLFPYLLAAITGEPAPGGAPRGRASRRRRNGHT